jgi:hypothetical protein
MAAETESKQSWRAAIYAMVAVIVIAIFAVTSWVSWVGVGTLCVNNNIAPGSTAAAVCEIELPNWHGNGSSTSVDNLYEYFTLALPLLILLIGIAASRILRRPRIFWGAASVATLVLLLPWLALILLPRS